MNKKGFTLTEILLAIAIIAIILIIAVPSIIKISSSIKAREFETKKTLILSAAESYGKNNQDIFGNASQVEITVGNLMQDGYVSIDASNNESDCNRIEGCIFDPTKSDVEESLMNDRVIIIKRNNSIMQAEFKEIEN